MVLLSLPSTSSLRISCDEARQALQRETDADPLWEVIPTYAGWGGDHVAVNGATATFIPIAVGRHFENRGMRPDQHDALGLELSVAGASQLAKEALPSRWWCFSACRPRRRCESPYCLWHQPSQSLSETTHSETVAGVPGEVHRN